jgi:hypothetical protein
MRRPAGAAGGVVRLGSAIGDVCWARAGGGTLANSEMIKQVVATALADIVSRSLLFRHCEPTGPARSGRPDDKLREAIQYGGAKLDCFVASLLAMTV